jgi:hypothetical protein
MTQYKNDAICFQFVNNLQNSSNEISPSPSESTDLIIFKIFSFEYLFPSLFKAIFSSSKVIDPLPSISNHKLYIIYNIFIFI